MIPVPVVSANHDEALTLLAHTCRRHDHVVDSTTKPAAGLAVLCAKRIQILRSDCFGAQLVVNEDCHRALLYQQQAKQAAWAAAQGAKTIEAPRH